MTVWTPDKNSIATTNISRFMAERNIRDVKALHRFSVEHSAEFWQQIIATLGIIFKIPPTKICDLTNSAEHPQWLLQAKLNIIESCFSADPAALAVVYQNSDKQLQEMTYGKLNQFSNRIANSLLAQGLRGGDPIAIIMPMTIEAVAIYLGVIKMGGVVVSIADSFSSEEIATRLQITNTKAIFTQDFILRESKKIPLYEKIIAISEAPTTFVLSTQPPTIMNIRPGDISWQDFLVNDENFTCVPCDPNTPCNILFSSGTTATPKAIPWNHTTPIKVASDAFFHQNIQAGDRLAWPTNLGWMMGPWLIFAALLNHATIALFPDVARGRDFGEFVQNAKVTMLGVVPTLVATWRQTQCMEKLDWHHIKAFSSTGECSNTDDMSYLMALADNKPIIEYCGGTEIGGAYLTSTVIEKNYPATFTTPAMGIDLLLLDEKGNPSNTGEVALIPPSLGLSTELLNADHHQVYFANMPSPNGKILRRHGDQATRLENGNYLILGRVDDTMNLGGIKISAAEIERTLVGIPHIKETAAIAITPIGGGPSQLIIYAATDTNFVKENIQLEMQKRLGQYLNPLFKIHDLVFVNDLPKTASNKIMRRVLREHYSPPQL